MPISDQKRQYLTKNANIWPKMPLFGQNMPNLAVFGPKILIFPGVSKSFGTLITEDHLGTLFELFWVGHEIKWAKKVNIWPKMPVLGQILPFFGGGVAKPLVPSYQETSETPILC